MSSVEDRIERLRRRRAASQEKEKEEVEQAKERRQRTKILKEQKGKANDLHLQQRECSFDTLQVAARRMRANYLHVSVHQKELKVGCLCGLRA